MLSPVTGESSHSPVAKGRASGRKRHIHHHGARDDGSGGVTEGGGLRCAHEHQQSSHRRCFLATKAARSDGRRTHRTRTLGSLLVSTLPIDPRNTHDKDPGDPMSWDRWPKCGGTWVPFVSFESTSSRNRGYCCRPAGDLPGATWGQGWAGRIGRAPAGPRRRPCSGGRVRRYGTASRSTGNVTLQAARASPRRAIVAVMPFQIRSVSALSRHEQPAEGKPQTTMSATVASRPQ